MLNSSGNLPRFAGILLDLTKFWRNSTRIHRIPATIKMLKNCALIAKIGVDTADTLIRWWYSGDLALCQIKMKMQTFIPYSNVTLENLQPAHRISCTRPRTYRSKCRTRRSPTSAAGRSVAYRTSCKVSTNARSNRHTSTGTYVESVENSRFWRSKGESSTLLFHTK